MTNAIRYNGDGTYDIIWNGRVEVSKESYGVAYAIWEALNTGAKNTSEADEVAERIPEKYQNYLIVTLSLATLILLLYK